MEFRLELIWDKLWLVLVSCGEAIATFLNRRRPPVCLLTTPRQLLSNPAGSRKVMEYELSDNGKENGNYYNGSYRDYRHYIGVILG